MSKQRTAFYRLRNDILRNKDKKEYLMDLAREKLEEFIDTYASEKIDPADWDTEGLREALIQQYGLETDVEYLVDEELLSREELLETLWDKITKIYERKEEELGEEFIREHERMLMLHIIDSQWKDHLYAMDHLKEGIGLQGYAQKDPLVEYKKESFEMFQEMQDRMGEEIVKYLFLLEPAEEEMEAQQEDWETTEDNFIYSADDSPDSETYTRDEPKVGRNDPCPCESGKKYKYCCGR